MSQRIDLLPALYMIFATAALVVVFALLIYSIVVSDGDFAHKKAAIRIFQLFFISVLAAFAFGLASIVVILVDKHMVNSKYILLRCDDGHSRWRRGRSFHPWPLIGAA